MKKLVIVIFSLSATCFGGRLLDSLDAIRIQNEARSAQSAAEFNALNTDRQLREIQETLASQSSQSSYHDAQVQYARSSADVKRCYPMVLLKNSPINAKAAEIHALLEEKGSPIIHNPDLPWIIYSKAAELLNIKAVESR